MRAGRKTVLVLLGLVALTGVSGILEHQETRTEDAAKLTQLKTGTTAAPAGAPADCPGRKGKNGVFQSNIPVLSPLALGGLSGLSTSLLEYEV